MHVLRKTDALDVFDFVVALGAFVRDALMGLLVLVTIIAMAAMAVVDAAFLAAALNAF